MQFLQSDFLHEVNAAIGDLAAILKNLLLKGQCILIHNLTTSTSEQYEQRNINLTPPIYGQIYFGRKLNEAFNPQYLLGILNDLGSYLMETIRSSDYMIT